MCVCGFVAKCLGVARLLRRYYRALVSDVDKMRVLSDDAFSRKMSQVA